jgi:hypothetical protein
MTWLVSLIFMTSFAIELSLPCSYDSKLEDENLEHIYILVVLSLLRCSLLPRLLDSVLVVYLNNETLFSFKFQALRY